MTPGIPFSLCGENEKWNCSGDSPPSPCSAAGRRQLPCGWPASHLQGGSRNAEKEILNTCHHKCPFWLFWSKNRWRFLVYLVPTKTDHRKKVGTLLLTSPPEDQVSLQATKTWPPFEHPNQKTIHSAPPPPRPVGRRT